MGKPTGFKEHHRETGPLRPVEERLRDHREVGIPLEPARLTAQASRCMDCGLPFCHSPHGCPLGNRIPDWNEAVYQGRWRDALEALVATNNFPELTGRVCPAPCETACVLGINDEPVTIKSIEQAIADRAFEGGWPARPPPRRTGKRVAVVGSGPAGLAVADQLNRAGHTVTVLERADRIGGLLTYGIPDFKLEKRVVEARLALLAAEGVRFRTGVDVDAALLAELRAEGPVCLCVGATRARELTIPGRELGGVHLAMDFLTQHNRRVGGLPIAGAEILATGKRVVVLGGGDTGADCVGTANRQGARSVTQLELLPMPPAARPRLTPWPHWPLILRTSSSHEEGCERSWSVSTTALTGEDGRVSRLHAVRLEWSEADEDARRTMRELPGSAFTIDAELVLLALGFSGPEHEELGELALDPRGNLRTDGTYQTSLPGVFAAGDARRGQSLVVWAIAEGRRAARAIDVSLMGQSALPA